MQLAPKGEQVMIGSDNVDVWSRHCVNGHHCIQCYLTGKIQCAPRFWFYRIPTTCPGYPAGTKKHNSVDYTLEVPLDIPTRYGNTLADSLAAQPLRPMPDGGYVEEVTNLVMQQPTRRRDASTRITDDVCGRCGHEYLEYVGRRKESTGQFACLNHRNTYKCSRCGSYQTENTKRIPECMKKMLKELREQGISQRITRERIRQQFGRTISVDSYARLVKKMGLPPRKFARTQA